jgi:hypothetical protein
MQKQNKIMKKTNIFWVFGVGCFVLGLCSCSSDDDTTPKEDSNGRCLRQLTLSDVSMNTRATINPSTYAAAWETTDRPTYINLSAQPELRSGTLTPSEASASTSLTGDVYCRRGDSIAVILPTVTPELPSGGTLSFPINLNGQKGTLDSIGARYHYIYGVGSVVATEGSTATGTITNTKSLLSLCKFTFTHDNSPVNVKSVQINYKSESTGNLKGYPQAGTVSLAYPANVHVTAGAPIEDKPLVVTLDNANTAGVVYVAMFPEADKQTFHFTVSNGTNTYTATKTAKMLEGKYYEVPVAVN